MALLRNKATGESLVLRARHLFGRSPAVDTALTSTGVSGEHAVVNWTGAGWVLRDLGSRNGTWVGAKRAEAGNHIPLAVGDQIGFGDPNERWVLTTDAAPSVVATCGELLLEGEGTFLALPDLDAPQVVIERDHELGWVQRRDDETRPIADREVIVLGDQAWQVALPSSQDPTEAVDYTSRFSTTGDRNLADARLELAVSGDEEYVEATVHWEGFSHAIPPKAHHYLLVVLARARIDDGGDDRRESERGWIYSSDLRGMLGVTSTQFYVMCHRCRREFEELGVPEASEIIERRTTSRQLRIGISDLLVRPL